MLTPKENYLVAAYGGKPEWVPLFPAEANFYFPAVWNDKDDENKDFFGVRWIEEKDSGWIPDLLNPPLESIKQWRDLVRFPIIADMDWEKIASDFKADENYSSDKVTIAMTAAWSLFLVPVHLLGWENALVAIYEDREELEEFISILADWIMELIDYMGRYIKPNIMFSGDDMSSSTGPFISKEIWHSLYQPYFRKIAERIHANGALAEFHNCGNNQYFVEEFLATGADIVQLPVPNAELDAVKERLGNRLVMTGGWDRIGEGAKLGASEEVVRESARQVIDKYGLDGSLIFWDGGIYGDTQDAKNKMEWLYDEINRYSREVYRRA